jgi:hypothetical protein
MTLPDMFTSEALLYAFGLFALWDIVIGPGRTALRLFATAAISLALMWARPEMFPLINLTFLVEEGTFAWEWPAYTAWGLVFLAWIVARDTGQILIRACLVALAFTIMMVGFELDLQGSRRHVIASDPSHITPQSEVIKDISYEDLVELLATSMGAPELRHLAWVRSPGREGNLLVSASGVGVEQSEIVVGIGLNRHAATMSWIFYILIALTTAALAPRLRRKQLELKKQRSSEGDALATTD